MTHLFESAWRVSLGSARATRAGEGALAIANFSFFPEHCGEAPQ